MERAKKRVAAMADIHVKSTDRGLWKDTFEQVNTEADVLIICGDLTDTGDEDEAKVLGEALHSLHIPVIGVLGNHDFEKGRQKIIKQILTEHKMTLLDGEFTVACGIGFAGTKGFGGGFDQFMLSIFGEDMMKEFVHEAVNESLQLDRALTRLEQEHPNVPKVALLHYAPIKSTVEGEPEQLYPFLGSSHLAEALNTRQVAVAFHGHAHGGTIFGQTSNNIPVYNVALPLLKTQHPGTSYMIVEV